MVRVTFANAPTSRTLSTVARPGFSRIGIQRSNSSIPIRMDTVPNCIPVNPARPSLRTSQGPRPKLACFMKAMLKPKHANPMSNFVQRLTEVLNDDELDLIFQNQPAKPLG